MIPSLGRIVLYRGYHPAHKLTSPQGEVRTFAGIITSVLEKPGATTPPSQREGDYVVTVGVFFPDSLFFEVKNVQYFDDSENKIGCWMWPQRF